MVKAIGHFVGETLKMWSRRPRLLLHRLESLCHQRTAFGRLFHISSTGGHLFLPNSGHPPEPKGVFGEIQMRNLIKGSSTISPLDICLNIFILL